MRALYTALLALVASVGSLADEIKPFDFTPDTQPTCGFPKLDLPAEFVVYAAGAYAGREISFQIDQSGHPATQIDVAVNSPSKPVVLMLGAYEPTIWNIGWSEQTRILAVLASGYHRQAVAGLQRDTPLLVTYYDNGGPCEYFYVVPDKLARLNPLSRRHFGRAVDMVYPAAQGKVVVGEPVTKATKLVTSAQVTPESYRDNSAALAGRAGLEDAVRKGVLRLATSADAEAWYNAMAQNPERADRPPVAGAKRPSFPDTLANVYVVVQPFRYPGGLYGAKRVVFLIPKGVPKPEGHPGHSVVYDFNTLVCDGSLCGKR